VYIYIWSGMYEIEICAKVTCKEKFMCAPSFLACAHLTTCVHSNIVTIAVLYSIPSR